MLTPQNTITTFSSDGTSPDTLIRSEHGLASSVSSVNLTGFHLHDGDRVRVAVTATNNVDASTSATSDGVTVDLTEPVLITLVDGDSLDSDLQYTVGTRFSFRCVICDMFVCLCLSVKQCK